MISKNLKEIRDISSRPFFKGPLSIDSVKKSSFLILLDLWTLFFFYHLVKHRESNEIFSSLAINLFLSSSSTFLFVLFKPPVSD